MHLCKLTRYLPQNKAPRNRIRIRTKTEKPKQDGHNRNQLVGVCLRLGAYKLVRLEPVELTISRGLGFKVRDSGLGARGLETACGNPGITDLSSIRIGY